MLSGIVCLAMVGFAGTAQAGKCAGSSARIYAKPATVHKTKDGSQTFHLQSTGTTIQTVGANASPAGVWQHCTGFWTAKADKSGSGFGNCYTVDDDGDQRIISWEAKQNGAGTWKHVSGTGKYASNSDSGSWKSGKRFPNGMRTGTWEGECSD
jgi:hypothetical protein